MTTLIIVAAGIITGIVGLAMLVAEWAEIN